MRTVRAALAFGAVFWLVTADAAAQVQPPHGKLVPTPLPKPLPPSKQKPEPPKPGKGGKTEPAKPVAPKPEPRRLPETSSLQNELTATKQKLQPVSARVQRALSATEAAQAKVRKAIAVVKRIAQIDDMMKRMIGQLTPIAKLPPTRSIDPLVDALTLVQKQIHPVRVKADAANKKVLTPTDKKLKKLEANLEAALAGLKDCTTKIESTKAHATTLRELVATRGDKPAEVGVLESLSAGTRPALPPVNTAIQALDDSSAAVESEVYQFARTLAAVTDFEPIVEKLWDAVEPINKTARDLDKTLKERIEIEVLGAKVGFTVRQIIEGPGDVADAILKPLEKLAEDALKPIIKAMKLEIKPPKELEALGEALNALAVPDLPALAKLETALADKGVANLQASLAKFLAKKTIP